jgi:hypothetical protein
VLNPYEYESDCGLTTQGATPPPGLNHEHSKAIALGINDRLGSSTLWSVDRPDF